MQNTKLKFSHVDSAGKARMVDVSSKDNTFRLARASGRIKLKPTTLRLIRENEIKKGDVIGVARIAGIQGAKKVSELIPLCHNLLLTDVEVEFRLKKNKIEVESTVKCFGKTGVEMEALTAVACACLTIYDMCKGVDREMRIEDIFLLEKRGGRSGVYKIQGFKWF